MYAYQDYLYDDDQNDNRADQSQEQPRSGKEKAKRDSAPTSRRAISYARRGAAPTVYNGIHRRRQRRVMW